VGAPYYEECSGDKCNTAPLDGPSLPLALACTLLTLFVKGWHAY
jgi:hypothetical protein